jgi:hypothetical protein
MAIHTTTITLEAFVRNAIGDSWVPTTTTAADTFLGQLLFWGYKDDSPHYEYQMVARAASIPEAVTADTIISATLRMDGSVARSFTAADVTYVGRVPDILISSASGLANDSSDHAGVTTGDIYHFVMPDLDVDNTVTVAEPLDTGLFTSGTFEFRVGFDAALVPTTFPTPTAPDPHQVEQATYHGSVWIEIEYDVPEFQAAFDLVLGLDIPITPLGVGPVLAALNLVLGAGIEFAPIRWIPLFPLPEPIVFHGEAELGVDGIARADEPPLAPPRTHAARRFRDQHR